MNNEKQRQTWRHAKRQNEKKEINNKYLEGCSPDLRTKDLENMHYFFM